MRCFLKRFPKKLVFAITLIFFTITLWGDIGITGDMVGRVSDFNSKDVNVRVLEGRITTGVVVTAVGPYSVIFGSKNIFVESEKCFITAGVGGGLILKIGGREFRTSKAVKIVLVASAGEGTLIVALDNVSAKPITHNYRGELKITNDAGVVAIINIIPLEEYLCSVVASEMSTNEMEAMKAQAILARTFAVRNRGRHKKYDFCDKTHCQHYGGAGLETSRSITAVRETTGKVLLFDGAVASVFYHACCGGMTTSPAYVWGGDEFPYLKPVKCQRPGGGGYLCGKSRHFRWEATITSDEMRSLIADAFGVSARGAKLKIMLRDPSGRVFEMEIMGTERRVITGEEFRIAVGRALGWGRIKSALFEMKIGGDGYRFGGSGLGHGVGRCQLGAIELSRLGWSYVDILQFYFPGTVVGEFGGEI